MRSEGILFEVPSSSRAHIEFPHCTKRSLKKPSFYILHDARLRHHTDQTITCARYELREDFTRGRCLLSESAHERMDMNRYKMDINPTGKRRTST